MLCRTTSKIVSDLSGNVLECSVHKAHVFEERCLQRNRVEGVGLIKEGIRLGLLAAVRLDRSTVVGLGGRSITGVSGGFRCCVVVTVVRVATGGGEQRKDGDQKRNEETVAVLEHDRTLPTDQQYIDSEILRVGQSRWSGLVRNGHQDRTSPGFQRVM